jgi:hypothetical protein
MPEPSIPSLPAPDRSNWNPAQPEVIPEPTLWPAALALGSTLLLWGIASAWMISGVGAALWVVALAGWIGEIRHERKRTLRQSTAR